MDATGTPSPAYHRSLTRRIKIGRSDWSIGRSTATLRRFPRSEFVNPAHGTPESRTQPLTRLLTLHFGWKGDFKLEMRRGSWNEGSQRCDLCGVGSNKQSYYQMRRFQPLIKSDGVEPEHSHLLVHGENMPEMLCASALWRYRPTRHSSRRSLLRSHRQTQRTESILRVAC